MKKQATVTTAICLDINRQKKDQTYPVKLRLTYLRKQRYYNLGYSLTKDEFLKAKAPRAQGRNKANWDKLKAKELEAQKIIEGLTPFSFELFKKKYTNPASDLGNVFNAFKAHIKDLESNGQINTASTYKTALKSIEGFSRKERLLFEDITPGWLKDYEKYMIRKGKSVTTISMNVRCIRHLFNKAIFNDHIKGEFYPFSKHTDDIRYKIPEHRNIKKALKKYDIKKIFDYKPLPGSPEHFYRDLWLFSYLCSGMNMADIFRLRYSHIQGNTIKFDRHKTAHNRKTVSIVVPLLSEAKEIINRWGVKPVFPNNYIFNVLTKGLTPAQEVAKVKQATKMTNKHIKNIAVKVGIDDNISTYWARHSFATIMKNEGVPVAFIKEQMGHSNINTTENYLGSFESEQAQEYAKKVIDF